MLENRLHLGVRVTTHTTFMRYSGYTANFPACTIVQYASIELATAVPVPS